MGEIRGDLDCSGSRHIKELDFDENVTTVVNGHFLFASNQLIDASGIWNIDIRKPLDIAKLSPSFQNKPKEVKEELSLYNKMNNLNDRS